MKNLLDRIHEIIGPLSADDFARLKANILRDGIIVPVIKQKSTGRIIDGQHRANLMKDYPVIERDIDDKEAARQAVALNLARRHLSTEQKREIIRLLRAEGFTQEEVGEMVGLTHAAIAMQNTSNVKIDNACIPDLRIKLSKRNRESIEKRLASKETQKQIAADYGISQQRVAQIGKKKEETIRTAKSEPGDDENKIITGDFKLKGDIIKDGSVDLIFTDPPYGRKNISLYSDLAIFANRILKPGASLLAYCGHSVLPDIFEAMKDKGLIYWWTIAIKHGGHIQRFAGKWVFIGWKPILWFVKKKRRDQEFISDFFVGKENKVHHEWEQGIEEAEYYISNLTQKNQLICDPFCGSGTSCLAAKRLGRKYIGYEIVSQTAEKARERLNGI